MIRQVAASEWLVQPWRNGGGSTREIARWPAGAGDLDFVLRVSVAVVERDGPFSTFVGFTRTTILLSATPIVLADNTLATIGDRIDVAGERPLAASLLGGPATLLNVLHARSRPTTIGWGQLPGPVRCAIGLPSEGERLAVEPAVGSAWIADRPTTLPLDGSWIWIA